MFVGLAKNQGKKIVKHEFCFPTGHTVNATKFTQ